MNLLETSNLEAWYGDFQALFGINFVVNQGETVAIIGSNGAGKSTFLKTLVGLIPSLEKSIYFNGNPIGHLSADQIHQLGISLVPEGRRLFSSLTVEENLLIGNYSKRKGAWNLERVYKLFPVLKEKQNDLTKALSGGQQQMLAIGRGLMSNPSLLLCDEISLGLAPTLIKDLYAVFPAIHEDGTTILVVEQDINQALAISDRVYCFQEGSVALEGIPKDLTRDQIKVAYFGM